jgi:hypothetical protein
MPSLIDGDYSSFITQNGFLTIGMVYEAVLTYRNNIYPAVSDFNDWQSRAWSGDELDFIFRSLRSILVGRHGEIRRLSIRLDESIKVNMLSGTTKCLYSLRLPQAEFDSSEEEEEEVRTCHYYARRIFHLPGPVQRAYFHHRPSSICSFHLYIGINGTVHRVV